MVVVEPVVRDGHDPPSFGSSEIQHDISASSVAARVDGAVDHLAVVAEDAALAAGEAERHQGGIESCDDLPEHHVTRLIVGGRHLVMMVDQGHVSPPDIDTHSHHQHVERAAAVRPNARVT